MKWNPIQHLLHWDSQILIASLWIVNFYVIVSRCLRQEIACQLIIIHCLMLCYKQYFRNTITYYVCFKFIKNTMLWTKKHHLSTRTKIITTQIQVKTGLLLQSTIKLKFSVAYSLPAKRLSAEEKINTKRQWKSGVIRSKLRKLHYMVHLLDWHSFKRILIEDQQDIKVTR